MCTRLSKTNQIKLKIKGNCYIWYLCISVSGITLLSTAVLSTVHIGHGTIVRVYFVFINFVFSFCNLPTPSHHQHRAPHDQCASNKTLFHGLGMSRFDGFRYQFTQRNRDHYTTNKHKGVLQHHAMPRGIHTGK